PGAGGTGRRDRARAAAGPHARPRRRRGARGRPMAPPGRRRVLLARRAGRPPFPLPARPAPLPVAHAEGRPRAPVEPALPEGAQVAASVGGSPRLLSRPARVRGDRGTETERGAPRSRASSHRAPARRVCLLLEGGAPGGEDHRLDCAHRPGPSEVRSTVSSTMYGGRPLTSRYVRPTYAPRM